MIQAIIFAVTDIVIAVGCYQMGQHSQQRKAANNNLHTVKCICGHRVNSHTKTIGGFTGNCHVNFKVEHYPYSQKCSCNGYIPDYESVMK